MRNLLTRRPTQYGTSDGTWWGEDKDAATQHQAWLDLKTLCGGLMPDDAPAVRPAREEMANFLVGRAAELMPLLRILRADPAPDLVDVPAEGEGDAS